jgi:hypothetical protein
MRNYSLLAGLVCVTGCYPVLVHKTRVEPGFQVSTVLNLAFVTDSAGQTGDVARGVVPSFDLEASVGIRDSSRDNGPGLRLSAFAGLGGYGGSAYVEAPRSLIGDFDLGFGLAGLHGGVSLWTPYVQIGRAHREDLSWFVRNGVAFGTPSDSADGAVVWIPTVGIFRHRAQRDASLFISAVVGRQQRVERACLFFDCLSSYSNSFVRTQVMLGASLSFTLMTPYRPDRR